MTDYVLYVAPWVNLPGPVYVLHVWKKKSHSGIKTDKQDIDIIEQRLKRVRG